MDSDNTEQVDNDGAPAACKSCSKFKVILVGLGILVAAFVGVVAMQPSEFRVSRSATMAAPPATIFAQVNDFHNWEAWSPWAELDPNAESTFEGPSSGTGAILKWSGNSDVGEGSMKITESRPNELIRIQLDFVKPMEGTSDVEFQFQPEGDQTKVTWTMAGTNNFMAKAISLFMDCEKMVSDMYDEGLANLKSVVEGTPQVN